MAFSDCQITEDGVCLQVFFFTKTIAFSDIKSVQKVPFWKVMLEGMHPFKPPMYCNGAVFCSDYVIIETRKLRYAVTVRDGDKFVRLVSSHLTISN
jgi:hypothetical protein